MIGIINYGMGNLRSVQNSLTYCQLESMIIDNPRDLSLCSRFILPGVGAFGEGMVGLTKKGFIEPLKEQVFGQLKPLMGICLGMQLLLESSCEHGLFEGLGFVKGHVRALADKVEKLPLPHMGWNNISIASKSKLLQKVDDTNFYFVHSFYCDLADKNVVTGTVQYGIDIDIVFESNTVMGCQFHPEKSQVSGLQILKNFGSWHA